MKFWENFSFFDKANKAWNYKSKLIEKKRIFKKNYFDPKIKISLPNFFKIRSLIYLIKQDKNFKFLNFLIKKPLYFFNLLKSYFSYKPYLEDKNIFFYNLKSIKDLKKIANNKNALFIFGFSYCQKPLKCPKKRFSSECSYNYKNAICLKCYIGKFANALSKKDIFFVIPNVRFMAQQLIDIIKKNKNEEIVFIISSCELSIKMFSDFANMLKIKGLALKLTGRICSNFKSFLYAEKGKKLGFTNLENTHKDLFLEIFKIRYNTQKRN